MSPFFFVVILFPCIFGVILVPPHSVNTTLNSNVTFTCISNATHTDWYVDNMTEEAAEIKSRNIEPSVEMMVNIAEYGKVLKSYISVPATLLPNNNGTEIRCKVADCPVSPAAVLLVQGTLGPVRDLRVVTDNESVQVMWRKPYSLYGVSIFGFNVTLIENATGMVVLDDFYDNSTENIEVSPSLIMCQAYQVNLWARNAVGRGSAAIVSWFNPEVVPSVSKSDVSTTVRVDDMNFAVSINVKAYIACLKLAPYNATVHLVLSSNDVSGDNIFSKHSDPLISANMLLASLLFVIDSLPPRQLFDMDVLMCNIAGCTTSSKMATFSTFDTQQVIFGTLSDGLCFMCIFLANTSSTGCGISVHGVILVNTALRLHGSNHSEWSCPLDVTVDSVIGTTVIVFDVNDDGNIVLTPAITMRLTSSDEFIPLGFSDPEPSTAYISMVSSLLVSVSTVPPLASAPNEVDAVVIVVISVAVGLLVLMVLAAVILLAVTFQHCRGCRSTAAVEQDIPLARNLIYGVPLNTPTTDEKLSALEKNDVDALQTSVHLPNESFPSMQVGPHYDTIPSPKNGTGLHPEPLYETVPTNNSGPCANAQQVGVLFSTIQEQDISLSSTTECPAYRCMDSSRNYYKTS